MKELGFYGKLAKTWAREIPIVGSIIPGLELIGVVGASIRDAIDGNFNEDSWDRIALKGIDFVTSLIIPIPIVDIVAAENGKFIYKSSFVNKDSIKENQ